MKTVRYKNQTSNILLKNNLAMATLYLILLHHKITELCKNQSLLLCIKAKFWIKNHHEDKQKCIVSTITLFIKKDPELTQLHVYSKITVIIYQYQMFQNSPNHP